jgi:hypothetical protein
MIKQEIDYEKKTKRCRTCKEWKPFELFGKCNKVKSGLQGDCIACFRKYQREWMQKNYNTRPEVRAKRRKWVQEHREYYRERSRARNRRLRLECLSKYGGSPPKCACCKENTYEFLALDHVNNNGAEERRNSTWGKGGAVMYCLLRKRGFPEGYQVLCHNCNLAKGFYGKCPHKKEAGS